MGKQLLLKEELDKVCKTYLQPPSNVKMEYPCIVMDLTGKYKKHASNESYIKNDRFSIVFMSRIKFDSLVDEILKIKYSKFNRSYQVNQIYHTIIEIKL